MCWILCFGICKMQNKTEGNGYRYLPKCIFKQGFLLLEKACRL